MATLSFSQMYGRRFSEEEQMAFGRWAHLHSRTHLGGIAGQSLGLAMSRRASEPCLKSPASGSRQSSDPGEKSPAVPLSSTQCSSRADLEPTSMDASPTASPGKQRETLSIVDRPPSRGEYLPSKVDHSLVQSVLEKLLPAEDVPSPSTNLASAGQNCAADKPPGRSLLQPALPAFISTTPSNEARSALGVPTPSDQAWSRPGTNLASDGPAKSAGGILLPQALVPLSPKKAGKRTRSVARQKSQVLERFRWQLLQRFRSLHDAFARLHDLTTRENAFCQEDFCQAFMQLGVKEADCISVFAFMDFKGRASVSLAGLRAALVTTSKQSLLWELRCRLLTQGITPNDFSKVRKILEVARRPRHRTVRQRRRLQGVGRIGNYYIGRSDKLSSQHSTTEASDEASEIDWFFKADATYAWAETYESRTGFLPSSSRLSRTDWLHVCSAIGLTLLEAERLFPILSGSNNMVDLQEMFTVLRAGVAPHVSLERFATRVLTRFGSLQNAFSAVCDPVGRVVRWAEFHSLAVTLEVKDDNAEKLWRALNIAQQASLEEAGGSPQSSTSDGANTHADGAGGLTRPEAEDGANKEFVTESTFVKELTVWAPSTALDALRNQVDEHFSDLNEFRYALTEAGWAPSSSLCAEELEKALTAVGVNGLSGERIFSAVSSSWRGSRKAGTMSFEDIIEAMQSTNPAGNGSMARSAVRDDLRAIWQQLRTVQADLRSSTPTSECCRPLRDAEGNKLPRRQECAALCAAHQPRSRLRGSASLPSLRSGTGQRSKAAKQHRRRGTEA
mmetsp:Transcript_142244/g.248026  ORF Transcript_142244/g.248026 Transcript_142244/m.248026 type:complete len:789 (-) Transcript_142244:48-2414(-)